MRAAGLVLALLAAVPALAQPRQHPRRSFQHLRAGHRGDGSVPYPQPWGSAVYGSSLPFVEGSCVDPYDPDPIGGPNHVGEGGPGGYGPQCREQAGVIPYTVVR